MGGVSYNWIGTDGFEVKSETERFNAVYPRCHQNLTFGHSRYSSIGVGGTSTFFKMCSYRPTPYYFTFNGFVFLISYF